jgi:hypothetical protein
MKFNITESEKSSILEMYGLLNESIQFGGISAYSRGGNIVFNKNGKEYTYRLEAEILGPNISISVNNLYNDGGVLKMEYSHIGGTGVSDLGQDNLNKIINQIPNDQISFTTHKGPDKGREMILTKV